MKTEALFASLIMLLAAGSVEGLAANENTLATTSITGLPPFPDLPMPGTHTRVIGHQSVPQGEPLKAEPSKPMTPVEETKAEEPPWVGVFQADRASALVY